MATAKLFGARVKRVEDNRFLRGRAVYTDDVRLQGTLHVAFVRSPHAHAKITSAGLPIGLHLAGRAFADATVLQVAHAYEQASEWHRRRPPLD